MSDATQDDFRRWATGVYNLQGDKKYFDPETEFAWLMWQAATSSIDAEWRALCEKLVGALTQILDDGEHISDYVGADETPVFNRNGKQGFYCYAAAEQAMEALAEAKLKGVV